MSVFCPDLSGNAPGRRDRLPQSKQIPEMENDFSNLNQKFQQLSAEMALLKAQQGKMITPTSPWLPLKEAAGRLNFPSPRSLKRRIDSGHFPPDCYRVDPTSSGPVTRYIVHVERYIKQLG